MRELSSLLGHCGVLSLISLALLPASNSIRVAGLGTAVNRRQYIMLSTHKEAVKSSTISRHSFSSSVSLSRLSSQSSDSDVFGAVNGPNNDSILGMYDRMKSSPIRINDSAFMNSLLKSLMLMERDDEATILLKNEDKKHTINAESYVTVMMHHINQTEHDDARKVYDMMKQMNVSVTDTNTGNSLLRILMSLNEFNEGCVVLQSMSASGVADDNSANILTQPYYTHQNTTCVTSGMGYAALTGLVHMKKYNEERTVLNDLQSRGVADIRCYELLVKEYTAAGRYNEVVILYTTIKSSQMYPSYRHIGDDILTSLFAATTMTDQVGYFLDQLLPDFYTLTDKKWYIRMIDSFMYSYKFFPRNRWGTYTLVRNRMALDIYEFMKMHRIEIQDVDEARIILGMLIDTGEYDEYERVRHILLPYPEFKNLCFVSQIKYYMTQGRIEKANKAYNTMKNSKIPITSVVDGITIMTLLMQQGKLMEAEQLQNQLFNQGIAHTMTYYLLCKEYLDKNRRRDAMRIYQQIKSLNVIIADADIGSLALGIILNMEDYDHFDYMIKTMKAPISLDDDMTYILWLMRHIKVKVYDKALKICDILIRERFYIQDTTLGNLMLTLVLRYQLHNEACNIYNQMIIRSIANIQTFQIYINSCIERRDYYGVAGVYRSYLRSRIPKDHNIISGKSIIDFLLCESKLNLAAEVFQSMVEAGQGDMTYYNKIMTLLNEEFKERSKNLPSIIIPVKPKAFSILESLLPYIKQNFYHKRNKQVNPKNTINKPNNMKNQTINNNMKYTKKTENTKKPSGASNNSVQIKKASAQINKSKSGIMPDVVATKNQKIPMNDQNKQKESASVRSNIVNVSNPTNNKNEKKVNSKMNVKNSNPKHKQNQQPTPQQSQNKNKNKVITQN